MAFATPVSVVVRGATPRSCESARPTHRLALAARPSRTSGKRVPNIPTEEGGMKDMRGKRVATFRKRQSLRASQKELIERAAAAAMERRKMKGRQKRAEGKKLSELKVGDRVSGVVQNNVPYGTYVDVGAVRDGLVHVRDMDVEFVHCVGDVMRRGMRLKLWVKYVDCVNNVLGLTMVCPKMGFENRVAVRDVKVGGRYLGVVERISNYGAYVDVGTERLGFLHVLHVWGDKPRETLEFMRLGEKIWVHVDDVDLVKSHVRLRARGVGGVRLAETGELGERFVEKKKGKEEGVDGNVDLATARPFDDVMMKEEEEEEEGKEEEEEEEEEDIDEEFSILEDIDID